MQRAPKCSIRIPVAILGLLASLVQLASDASASELRRNRRVFLNGVEISGAVGQEVKQADVHIADDGDIYINAPHYQVYEEDDYMPIGTYLRHMEARPAHQSPRGIAKGEGAPGAGAGGSMGMMPAKKEAMPKTTEPDKPADAAAGGREGAKAGSKSPDSP